MYSVINSILYRVGNGEEIDIYDFIILSSQPYNKKSLLSTDILFEEDKFLYRLYDNKFNKIISNFKFKVHTIENDHNMSKHSINTINTLSNSPIELLINNVDIFRSMIIEIKLLSYEKYLYIVNMYEGILIINILYDGDIINTKYIDYTDYIFSKYTITTNNNLDRMLGDKCINLTDRIRSYYSIKHILLLTISTIDDEIISFWYNILNNNSGYIEPFINIQNNNNNMYIINTNEKMHYILRKRFY